MSRPRPRPIVKQKNAEASSSSSSIPKLSELIVKDNDEMFMRNRSRDMNAWRKLEEKNKETKARSRSPDSDRNEDASPRRRKQKKKAINDAVPRWQRDKNLLRFLSEDASDGDADLDDDLAQQDNSPGKLKRKRTNRQRSRSRSITPPPAIPIQQLQNARNVIRQTLAPTPRPASPTQYDDDNLDASTDNIIFDPELASIAQRSKANFSASQITSEGSGTSTVVQISVRWQLHPENQGTLSKVEVFQMNRSENFRELFEAIAETQHILTDNLIITYQNKRVFPSVTPNTLSIWSSAEFVACNKTTYEYMRSSKYRTAKPPPVPVNPDAIVISSDGADAGLNITSDDDEPDSFFTAPPAVPDTDKEEDDGEKLKLTLRSKKTTQDIILVVRPTTTCGAIVRAFLKKAGLADEYPAVMNEATSSTKKKRGVQPKDPRIYIEGDKMDNEVVIGEADVEDGDMVEVGGL
ncbi:hypothetical protein IW262DRAFT_1375447 [Armillaria fumosa]|nr:hypothetical protein IW262DRAFT_1375447 [Armillaria fumosa]